MTTDHAIPLNVIAAAGMGWRHFDFRDALLGKCCNTCRHFEMRMIKSNESDSFGHLLPYCNHPTLPGDGGQPTEPVSSCNNWSAK